MLRKNVAHARHAKLTRVPITRSLSDIDDSVSTEALPTNVAEGPTNVAEGPIVMRTSKNLRGQRNRKTSIHGMGMDSTAPVVSPANDVHGHRTSGSPKHQSSPKMSKINRRGVVEARLGKVSNLVKQFDHHKSKKEDEEKAKEDGRQGKKDVRKKLLHRTIEMFEKTSAGKRKVILLMTCTHNCMSVPLLGLKRRVFLVTCRSCTHTFERTAQGEVLAFVCVCGNVHKNCIRTYIPILTPTTNITRLLLILQTN